MPLGHERHREVVREVRVDQRRLAGHGQLGIDDGRQRSYSTDDGVGRVARDVAIGGHDDRHRLAGVAHDVDGDGTMRGRRERRADRHRAEELGDLLPV